MQPCQERGVHLLLHNPEAELGPRTRIPDALCCFLEESPSELLQIVGVHVGILCGSYGEDLAFWWRAAGSHRDP